MLNEKKNIVFFINYFLICCNNEKDLFNINENVFVYV